MDTPTPPPPAPVPVPASQSNDKLLIILCHISYLFLGIIFPLIIWLVKKDESPYLAKQAKEALNYQITLTIAMIVLTIIPVLGWILIFPVWIAGLVFAIIAAIKSNDGVEYKYPVCLRLVK